MCLNPISVVNPTKYVSLKFRDPYLLQVPCGKCADCQRQLSNQWLFRTYYEFLDCLKEPGSFVYFDTLSYDDKHLPLLSSWFDVGGDDCSCFSPQDVTNFLKDLRITLDRHFQGVKFRYFLSSEYGHDKIYRDSRGNYRRGTKRPHYHLLFFVYNSNKIKQNQTKSTFNPLTFSQLVAQTWKFGLTDGIPYKSPSYVFCHNTIATNDMAQLLRTANYVTKYVQKSCEFSEELNKRINRLMNFYAEKNDKRHPERWLKTAAAARIKRQLKSYVNQFHRQSLHFGESALSELDLDRLFKDGFLVMPYYKGVKLKISLPTYYKRKLFYRLVEIDGSKSWQLNELGQSYKAQRHQSLIDDLTSRLQCVAIQHHLNFDCKALAEYVIDYRGRIRADLPSSSIEERCQQLDLFNYVTLQDKEALMIRGLTPQWLGNSSIGYDDSALVPYLPIKDFIANYVVLDSQKEKELSTIYYYLSFIDRGKQSAYELKQKLRQKFKCFL